jgi:hypothetical protein
MTATLTTMRTRKVWQKINACWQHVPEVEAYLEGLEWEGKIFPAIEENNPYPRLRRSPGPTAKARH